MKPNNDEVNSPKEEIESSKEKVNSSDDGVNTSEKKIDSKENTEEKLESPEDKTNTHDEELESPEEISKELEEEFQEEVAYEKEEEAGSEEELRIRIKKRILTSFKWQDDIIIPFSKELKITPEELEEILMKRLDMSSLEALHPRFESSKLRCTKEMIHADLKLCWLSDVMNILTEDEVEHIIDKIAFKILGEGESYEKALEEGRRELVEYLKR